MTNSYVAVNEAEQNAIVAVCILAAFADGSQSETERTEIKRIAENFSDAKHDLTLLYQQALGGKVNVAEVARDLQSANAKALAYEMAVCICNIDQALNPAEERFLNQLQGALNLDNKTAAAFNSQAAALRDQPPVIGSVSLAQNTDLDEMIRDTAILTGALELMPQRLATMAIVPVQMRMVYKIGKRFGYDLDLAHTKEFFATVGVGLASQAIDGYLSKLVGNVTRRFVGRFAGALLSQATESAIAFATTYALGQVAKTYYESGRTVSTGQLRELFTAMLNNGRSMQSRYTAQIAQRASGLKIGVFQPRENRGLK